MKQAFFIGLAVLFFSSFYSYSEKNNYTQLIMRDIAFILDDSEEIQVSFNKRRFFETPILQTTISDELSQILLSNSIPILTTHTLVNNIFAMADLFKTLTEELSPNELRAKFTENIYKSTIFNTTDSLLALANACKKLKILTYPIVKALKQYKVPQKNLNTALRTELMKKVDLTPFKLSLEEQKTVMLKALDLYKHFLIIEAIKKNTYDRRRVDDFLTLIIPQNYLVLKHKELSNFLNKLKYISKHPYNLNKNFHLDEAILGLKYKHFPALNLFDAVTLNSPLTFFTHLQESWPQTLMTLFISPKYHLLKDIFNIYVPDVADIIPSYFWNIYISGHGTSSVPRRPSQGEATTAGMLDETFKKMLLFFNSKINTNFLFYSSCFGAGSKLKLFNIPQQHFILVAGALAEIRTSTIIPPFFTLNSLTQKLEPFFYTSLSQAFSELREENVNYFELLNKIQLFWSTNMSVFPEFYIHNIPHIKFPNSEWFSLAHLNKQEFILNKRLIELHEHNKQPIVIKNKALLFLYPNYIYEDQKALIPQYITPTVIITERLPIVISMATNPAQYHFTEIIAKDFTLIDIAMKFIGKLKPNDTTIIISSLQVKNSVTGDGNKTNEASYKILLEKIGAEKTAPTLLLNNVQITNMQNKYVLQFEYLYKQYTIEAKSYDNFIQLLTSLNAENIAVTMPSPSQDIPLAPKKFEELEHMLQNRLKKNKQLNAIRNIQIMSQTLNGLMYASRAKS